MPFLRPSRASSRPPRPDILSLFLGRAMVDAYGYFTADDTPLAEAQAAAFDHIGRKLRPRPYQHLLDIECGRGAFLVHACKRFGVTGHGITSDPEAAEAAREQIRQEGLEGQAAVEYRGLRDLAGAGTYDRITYLGGLEQPGARRLPPVLGQAERLLKDNGAFLLQAAARRRSDRVRPGDDWLMDRIFPGGDPPSSGSLHVLLEDAGLEVIDLESLRRHAALTCTHWTEHLRSAAGEATDAEAVREQILELALRTVYLEEGRLTLHQLLATKADTGFAPVPLTREDIYA
jgi:cyclopropane-fatty-acyl-phospholipid synthase